MLIPMVLVFGIMWFFMIRPQQKKVKEDEAMRNALRRGDQVITQGGVIGKVTKVKEGESDVEIEIAKDVKVRIVRSAITTVVNKTEPVVES
jgi:preprotein translocase subunit YajC